MLQDLSGWWAEGFRLTASLNVGEFDPRHPGLLDLIDAKLETNGLPFEALDDFGTGTSSLTLLRALPRTAIKIDQSFVHDMVRDEGDLSIVRALSGLGHDLGIKVVAEGVESEEQAELLRQVGVDVFQGFLYGKPVPAREFTTQLRELRLAVRVRLAEPSGATNLPVRCSTPPTRRSRLG